MDIFSVLTLIGGLAMFLFGMNTMGDGLVKVSGGKLDEILERLTSNRLKGVLLGAAVTAVIQSSSVTTVMVIGFVNSGIMKLSQAVGVIMGANIGTTVTSWLLSLTGINGSGFWISMLKPSNFSPILAIIGVVLMMTSKPNTRKKNISSILLGFAVLMFGMTTMSGAVEPLADNARFTSILTMFSNPILGVLAGALLTAVIQSSSASIGILQALCMTGAVPYSVAIPVIMGQNIGTCATALISSIGAGKNAKRASMIHLYFNVTGTIVFMIVFYALNAAIGFSFLNQAAGVAGIALIHTFFNVACCVVWFPFANYLVKLATLTIPDEKTEKQTAVQGGESLAVLDERFLEKPAFAVQVCHDTSAKMAEYSGEIFDLAVDLIKTGSKETGDEILEMEQRIDDYQAALGDYLIKVNDKDLWPSDSRQVSVMLRCIMDFERISDHAADIKYSMDDLIEDGRTFTESGSKELQAFAGTIRTILDLMIRAYRDNDPFLAENILDYREVINGLSMEMKAHHIERLRSGQCSMEAGLVLEDILNDYERIFAHCLNVARCMLRSMQEEGYPVRLAAEGASD